MSDAPSRLPVAVDQDTGGEKGPSMPEVLKRREQIIKYCNSTYDAPFPEFDKAAKDTGFQSREEADSYLSKLTGCYWGPNLKTGDRIVNPVDGQDGVYYKTNKDALSAIKSGPDFYMKPVMLDRLRAYTYAEDKGTAIRVSPSYFEVFKEIVDGMVLDLGDGRSFTAPESGREYRMEGGKVYFNSTPDKDSIWGRLDQTEDDYYVLYDDTFSQVEKNQYYYDESLGENITIFVLQTGKNKKVFDKLGHFSKELTDKANKQNH